MNEAAATRARQGASLLKLQLRSVAGPGHKQWDAPLHEAVKDWSSLTTSPSACALCQHSFVEGALVRVYDDAALGFQLALCASCAR